MNDICLTRANTENPIRVFGQSDMDKHWEMLDGKWLCWSFSFRIRSDILCMVWSSSKNAYRHLFKPCTGIIWNLVFGLSRKSPAFCLWFMKFDNIRSSAFSIFQSLSLCVHFSISNEYLTKYSEHQLEHSCFGWWKHCDHNVSTTFFLCRCKMCCFFSS